MKTDPPKLKSIPYRGIGSDSDFAAERRQLPRLSLGHEQFKLASTGKIFSVADLSLGGMALHLIELDDLAHFTIGAEVHGILNLTGIKVEISAKVRRASQDRVGCEFGTLSKESSQALTHFLSPLALGRSLRPLPSSDSSSLWYHGASDTDLLLKRGVDGKWTHYFFAFNGSFVRFDAVENLQETGSLTGKTALRGLESGVVSFETTQLELDLRPDPEKLKIAKNILMSSNLPQDLRKLCLHRLGELIL